MAPNEQNQTPQQPQQPAAAPQQPAYEQQPVQQQYFAQQQQQPVQYVVMAQSLKGVRGWLMFFTILFGLAGIGYISIFFGGMDGSGDLVEMIFAPILAILSIVTVVLISLEKRIARLTALAVIGTFALYAVISQFVGGETSTAGSLGETVGAALISLVIYGLWGLYFVNSKRVKETLIK